MFPIRQVQRLFLGQLPPLNSVTVQRTILNINFHTPRTYTLALIDILQCFFENFTQLLSNPSSIPVVPCLPDLAH